MPKTKLTKSVSPKSVETKKTPIKSSKPKKQRIALITGSAGLIGSEATKFFIDKGYTVIGIDNDMRRYFFGDEASTDWNRKHLLKKYKEKYIHRKVDIRNQARVERVFKEFGPFDIIIHTAAQPSHDWAAKEPHTDFSVNALGTLILLEAYRQFSPKASFIFTSTNKVYGDTPNYLPLVEQETRYEIEKSHQYHGGIDESMSIDNSKHSIFGASKVAADIMVQEYGKYFDLNTAVFRGGCLTGPAHSGAELHGFLGYLVKCIVDGREYKIFGYKGKQVRDNIHSYDLVNMFWHFHQNPRQGEVYNAGGGRYSNISMLEAIKKIEEFTGRDAIFTYLNSNRIGDHIWYISDVSKFKRHYPEWGYEYDINRILKEMCDTGMKH